MCMSDFVAPRESVVEDFVGMFAVTAGIGCKEMCNKYVLQYSLHECL